MLLFSNSRLNLTHRIIYKLLDPNIGGPGSEVLI